MNQLENKTIVVTGASKGIGAAIVTSLGQQGAHVIAHYGSDRQGAEAASADIPAERIKLLQADFADPQIADEFWREAEAWRGRVDVLVCNAAVMRLRGGIEDDIEPFRVLHIDERPFPIGRGLGLPRIQHLQDVDV